jgi:hydroxymethylpyrimidine/phosphomethylpyrimidine kinase
MPRFTGRQNSAQRRKPVARRTIALTIAGSDPDGGAGAQADLNTFAALGVHGYSVITAITAQNSVRMERSIPVDPDTVTAQIELLAAERKPGAVKTGALANRAVVEAVVAALRGLKLPRPVVDPVIISSSGMRLLEQGAEAVLRERLISMAMAVTPNIPEAELLTGIVIDGMPGMREAAKAIHRMGARAVIVKGGHPFSAVPASRGVSRDGAGRVVDIFYDGRSFIELSAKRIATVGAHGTGCVFSAAIAACLARGLNLEESVRSAKRYVTNAIRYGYKLAPGGRLILNHFARR